MGCYLRDSSDEIREINLEIGKVRIHRSKMLCMSVGLALVSVASFTEPYRITSMSAGFVTLLSSFCSAIAFYKFVWQDRDLAEHFNRQKESLMVDQMLYREPELTLIEKKKKAAIYVQELNYLAVERNKMMGDSFFWSLSALLSASSLLVQYPTMRGAMGIVSVIQLIDSLLLIKEYQGAIQVLKRVKNELGNEIGMTEKGMQKQFTN